ncbi:efflux RND transporter periplasmic adaptor subunit [Paraneptunicella aestuarii]|uniref:efflux RND transporter periplasmic adaptor subunit n=1 Tax=Paraneptunicella aestuarii TaxID=2831148 RepID=UPI001E2843E9|nr:efflux RND transporter periplasmic adaptor subunit [Paraneptunicella aestuarii]UAA40058.1 efflux RND transporter periplasmic adaptor subunit [Paraneptunicella aestuarii]
MTDKIQALNELRIDRSGQKVRRANRNKKALAIALVVALGAGYMGWQEWSADDQSSHTARSVSRVDTSSNQGGRAESNVVVSNTSLSTTSSSDNDVNKKPSITGSILEVSGHITAQRIATVSAKTIGLINEVYVEEGVKVEEGQALAKLDTRIAELDLQLAESRRALYKAEVEKREAEILDAKRKLKRQQDLMSENFSNQSDIDTLTINIKVLEANLETAKTNVLLNELEIEQLQKRLSDHTIRAPFSGVVTTKNAQPGEIISPSSAGGGYTRTGICTIVDMASLEIEVDVNESFLNMISEGQRVQAELYAYEDWHFEGRVKKIVPTVDRSKATVRVRIEILEKSERILPNMAVRVSFMEDQAQAIAGHALTGMK